VSDAGIEKAQVSGFVGLYLTEGTPLVREVGYIPLQPSQYDEELDKVQALKAAQSTGAATN
jgi:hypothetical protein